MHVHSVYTVFTLNFQGFFHHGPLRPYMYGIHALPQCACASPDASTNIPRMHTQLRSVPVTSAEVTGTARHSVLFEVYLRAALACSMTDLLEMDRWLVRGSESVEKTGNNTSLRL